MENQIWEVIVIGAGISGIGASRMLTKHNIPHLMIESRNRIGGRIHAEELDGSMVELGASFVHSPQSINNLIAKFIKQKQWKTILTHSNSSNTSFLQGQGLVNNIELLHQGQQAYSQFGAFAYDINQDGGQDRSVEEVAEQFIKMKRQQWGEGVQMMVNWFLGLHANTEGSRLKDLSISEYLQNKSISSADYSPVGGYSKVVDELFIECKLELKLGFRVKKIDYSGEIVKVHTDKGVFECRYLISSLPLGIIQQQRVAFNPPLPQSYASKLNKMGYGNLNKLYVSFEKPFWKGNSGWVSFINKNGYNRFPSALIMNQTHRYILCVFVSLNPKGMYTKETSEEVFMEFRGFLRTFLGEDVKIRGFKATQWQHQEDSLGSYSFCRVGQEQREWSQELREAINGKVWLVGEHLHPDMYGCASGAYETGVWAADEIVQKIEEKN